MNKAEYMRQWRKRPGPSLQSVYLPAQPLLGMLESVYADSAPDRRVGKAMWRAKHSGTFTMSQADELCCTVLKRHPMELYGSAWLGDEG